MLISKAASPPIKPPSTQELSVLANIRSTAAPTMSTNATAAALIGPYPFLLYLDSEKYPKNPALLKARFVMSISEKRKIYKR
jgi:hypothetical protein